MDKRLITLMLAAVSATQCGLSHAQERSYYTARRSVTDGDSLNSCLKSRPKWPMCRKPKPFASSFT